MLNNVNILNLPDYGRSRIKNPVNSRNGMKFGSNTKGAYLRDESNLKGPSFKGKGWIDGKWTQKVLDYYKNHKVMFDSVSGFVFAAVCRPITFFATPSMENDDKVILSAKAIVSGAIGPIFTFTFINLLENASKFIRAPFEQKHELEALQKDGRKYKGLSNALAVMQASEPDYRKLAAALDGEELTRYSELKYDKVKNEVTETLKDFAKSKDKNGEIKINTIIDKIKENSIYSGDEEFARKFKNALLELKGINWTEEEKKQINEIQSKQDVFRMLAEEIKGCADIFKEEYQTTIEKQLQKTKEWLEKFRKLAGDKFCDYIDKDTRAQIGTRLVKSGDGNEIFKEVAGGLTSKLLTGPIQSIVTIASVPICMKLFNNVFFPDKKKKDKELKTSIKNINEAFIMQNKINNKSLLSGRVS